MTHLWVRAESRPDEERVGILPDGAARLISDGFRVTVEDSASRIITTDAYRSAGCEIAPAGSWPAAPIETFVFGLKELPDDGTPLRHRHIMFGHAFKDQPAGRRLLGRFRAGGGTLYDLEYLVDADGRRLAAFGYWAGYVGAAVSLQCLSAQASGGICPPVNRHDDPQELVSDTAGAIADMTPPRVLVIGALGRVGRGAVDLCTALDLAVTRWDMAETASGGPFPEVLQHEVFLNCVLAGPGCPVFIPESAKTAPRKLRVVGDIACDPDSDFSPIKVYDRATDRSAPALRVHESPPLDVMAIDNLPSLLPRAASEDFAAQLLPCLRALGAQDTAPWAQARATFKRHISDR